MKSFLGCVIHVYVVLVIAFVIESKINNNIFDAKLYVNKELPISRLQAAGHRFSIPSTDSHYQLSGDVLESQSISDQKQLYNISNYKKSESCTYFKSSISLNSLHGQNINFVALKSLVSEQTQQLFVIGVNDQMETEKKFVKVYQYSNKSFVIQAEVDFEGTSLSQKSDDEIFMAKIDDSILFSDGNFLFKLELRIDNKSQEVKSSWTRVQGFMTQQSSSTGEEHLGLKTVIFQNKQLLLFLYTNKIVFYEYQAQTNKAVIYLQILNSEQEPFEDVQIGFNNTQIYAIAGNQLLFYSLPNYKTSVKNALAGEVCNSIDIYKSTFHIICQYQKRNFIGEYFYNDTMNVLILNRFYNEIENYRLLSYVKNYFLMIGENDVILTSNGVNRKILLDMPKNAYSEKYVSFGIENIMLLQKFQDSEYSSKLIAVGEDFMVLFELKLIPAEIWCYIQRPPESLEKSILIVRNTSQCELNQQKQTLKSVCMNLKPIQIYFQTYELQSKVTSIFIIVVILLVCVLAFLCLGCVFRENINYNNVIREIKKKMGATQKKSNQQLNEI